jgi:hypothetical protein
MYRSLGTHSRAQIWIRSQDIAKNVLGFSAPFGVALGLTDIRNQSGKWKAKEFKCDILRPHTRVVASVHKPAGILLAVAP